MPFVVERDEAVGLGPQVVGGGTALAIGGIAIGESAGEIPGSVGMQVDGAADAAIGFIGGGRFDHVHAVEQRGRQHGEVWLLRVDLVRGNEHFAVQHGADLRQATHVHRGTHTGIAIDLHASDALQGVGDGGVGQRTDVFRGDAVLDVGSVAFQVDGAYLRSAHAGDRHGRQCDGVFLRVGAVGFGAVFVGAGRRWCRRLSRRRRGLRRVGLRLLAVRLDIEECRRNSRRRHGGEQRHGDGK
jgi:hypothetical protein